MSKKMSSNKGPVQAAAVQLKRIAKRNEATPKGAMAGATKKLVRTLQPKG